MKIKDQAVAAQRVVPLNTKFASCNYSSSGEEKITNQLLCCKDAELVWKCMDVSFHTRDVKGEWRSTPSIYH